MILYLSTAMETMVREDMNTATQGKVFTILNRKVRLAIKKTRLSSACNRLEVFVETWGLLANSKFVLSFMVKV